MPPRKVRGRVQLEGVDDFDRKANKVKKSVKGMGDSSKNSSKDMATLKTAGAAAAVGMAAAAAGALKLGQALHDLGMRGGEVSAIATAFERMTSPRMLAGLRQATGGLIRDTELMREATQAMRANLQSEDEIRRWYQVVARGAQDSGESIETMHTALGNMLSGGGLEEVLTKIGVPMSEVREEITRAGLSMESTAGRSRALSLALVQAEGATEGMDNSAGNLNDTWTALGSSAGNFYDQIARGFSENDRLLDVFRDLNEELGGSGDGFEELGDRIADTVADVIDFGATVISTFGNVQASIYEAIGAVAEFASEVGAASGDGIISSEQWAAIAARYQADAAGRRAVSSALQAGVEGRASREQGRQREAALAWRPGGGRGGTVSRGRISEMQRALERGGRSGGGGGGGSEEYDPFADIEDLTAGWDEMWSEYEQVGIDAHQSLLEKAFALQQAEADAREEEAEWIQERKEDEQEQHGLRLERLQELQDADREAAQKAIQHQEERFQKAQDSIGQIGQAVSALGDIFQMIADNQEEGSKKADAWRKVVGVAKGTYYAIEAIAAAAEAAKQGASQNYAGMALGIISAAKYAVASGYMFSKVAQTGGGGTVAESSAGVFTPSQPDRVNREETEDAELGRPITVIGLGNSDAGVAASMARANKELIRSGRPTLTSGAGVGFSG